MTTPDEIRREARIATYQRDLAAVAATQRVTTHYVLGVNDDYIYPSSDVDWAGIGIRFDTIHDAYYAAGVLSQDEDVWKVDIEGRDEDDDTTMVEVVYEDENV